jgi:hypothetical protein
MRTRILIGALCVVASASAQDSGFGIGLIVGEPTGISMKGWLDAEHAIDGALAWNFGHEGVFQLHGDYLFHKMDLIKVDKGKLPLYFGPGLSFQFWNGDQYWHDGDWHEGNSTVVSVRFPVGLDYLFEGAPVDAFFELVPKLDLVPSTWFGVDFGIGGRYWF